MSDRMYLSDMKLNQSHFAELKNFFRKIKKTQKSQFQKNIYSLKMYYDPFSVEINFYIVPIIYNNLNFVLNLVLNARIIIIFQMFSFYFRRPESIPRLFCFCLSD